MPGLARRGESRRGARIDGASCLKCIDNDARQAMRRQVEVACIGRVGPPQNIIAADLVEAEMTECVGQTRQVVSVKREDAWAPASLQAVHQNLQHLVGLAKAIQIAQQLAPLRQSDGVEIALELRIYRRTSLPPWAVIAHRDRKDEHPRSLGLQHRQHMLGQFWVGVIGGPTGSAERLDAEKGFEAQSRKSQIAAEEAAVERMQADGAIALAAQVPYERCNRRTRKGMVRVEPVVAQFALRDSGQHRELRAHRVGAPARNFETAEGAAAAATGVEP